MTLQDMFGHSGSKKDFASLQKDTTPSSLIICLPSLHHTGRQANTCKRLSADRGKMRGKVYCADPPTPPSLYTSLPCRDTRDRKGQKDSQSAFSFFSHLPLSHRPCKRPHLPPANTACLLGLLDLAVEDSSEEHVLGDLGPQIGIGLLLRGKDPGDLTSLCVDIGDLSHHGSLCGLEDLLVLLLELHVSLHTCLEGREGHCHIVSSHTSTSLGVKEQTGSVSGNSELALHLSAGSKSTPAGIGGEDEVLGGKEEGHTLPRGNLDGGGGKIDTLSLLKSNLSSINRHRPHQCIEGVRLS
mmetsp:Transcript_45735/g.90075  ORF Transcript_45735/g.90075 Transcript_45735/m.90075 type:complete len:298 (-) Transcript_45735:580-1473(-)